MKKIITITIIILSLFIIDIPPYVELNKLAIIDSIGIDYNNITYTVWLKEIIPIKDENGINYKYQYYKGTGKTIKNAYNMIEQKTKKKLYLKRVKLLITNLKTSDDITKTLNIKPKTIYHSKQNILNHLKKS